MAAGAPRILADVLTGLPVPAWVVVALILLVIVPLGMFLDSTSIILIMVPLTYPVVTELGMDGIWFGLLFIKLIEIGLLTPPLGLNAFVVAGIREDVSVPTAFRGVLWYVKLDVVVVAVMFAFPSVVTFIPSQMGLTS